VRVILSVFAGDLVFCWFASVYSAIAIIAAKFIGIPSVVIIGGVDAAKEPELNYGIWLSSWKSKLLSYALPLADCILAVDAGLKDDLVRLAQYNGKNISVLPTGYDAMFWKPLGEKEQIVLTVATATTEAAVRVKGLDTLIETVRLLPERSFLVIGTSPRMVQKLNPPENIKFKDAIPRRELLPYYQRAKIYCQPSRREGLPNTLCEAMACAAIPVVTDISGNRSAAGPDGILVPRSDPKALAAGIERAFTLTDADGARARARIVALFPKQNRERELLRIIDGLGQ